MTDEEAEDFDELCDEVAQARFRLETRPDHGNGQRSKCHYLKELRMHRAQLIEFIKTHPSIFE